jgi:hypothetical protein
MPATPGMWIGIRSVPTYGGSGVIHPIIIRACAVLTKETKPVTGMLQIAKPIAGVSRETKPIAGLTQPAKPIATITQRPC